MPVHAQHDLTLDTLLAQRSREYRIWNLSNQVKTKRHAIGNSHATKLNRAADPGLVPPSRAVQTQTARREGERERLAPLAEARRIGLGPYV